MITCGVTVVVDGPVLVWVVVSSRRATPAATHDDGPSTAAGLPVDPCCWAVLTMLSNAATIAVAGVGGVFDLAGDAGVSAAAWRPPELEVTAWVPVTVDGAEVVDVFVVGGVVVLPAVVDGVGAVVGVVVVGDAAVFDELDDDVVDAVDVVVGAV